LKVVTESRVTWAISVPILIGLSVLDIGPMYATGVRQTDVRQIDRRQTDRHQTASLLNAPAY